MAYDNDDDDFDDDQMRIDRPPDDYLSAQMAHWGGFLTGFVLPLILYLTQPNNRTFAAWHAREALNFQISLMIYYTVACVPMCLFAVDWRFFLIGLAVVGVIGLVEIVLIVMASLAVQRGEYYRVPMTIPFVARPRQIDEDDDRR